MQDKFEQLKKEAADIRMTESEKSLMRSRIQETMEHFPIREPLSQAKPVRSPFTFMMIARSVALVLVGFIGGGGGLAFASEQALPGDILYPIKTEITESVVSVLKTTPEAKIEWEEERIKRRAAELAELQIKGKLEEGRARIATDKIKESRASVDEQVVKLSEDLSFNGIVFSALPETAVSISATQISEVASLPIVEDIKKEDAVFEKPTEEDVASMRPNIASREGVTLAKETREAVQVLPEIEPNPAAVSGVATPTAQISERDFGSQVLERMTSEVDLLISNEKIEDSLATELNTLLETAEKLYENKEIKEFYETIRTIKEILEKILSN